jgi:uncharacterized protein YebE (UPF0316 family)
VPGDHRDLFPRLSVLNFLISVVIASLVYKNLRSSTTIVVEDGEALGLLFVNSCAWRFDLDLTEEFRGRSSKSLTHPRSFAG